MKTTGKSRKWTKSKKGNFSNQTRGWMITRRRLTPQEETDLYKRFVVFVDTVWKKIHPGITVGDADAGGLQDMSIIVTGMHSNHSDEEFLLKRSFGPGARLLFEYGGQFQVVVALPLEVVDTTVSANPAGAIGPAAYAAGPIAKPSTELAMLLFCLNVLAMAFIWYRFNTGVSGF